ncbi:MAG: sigma-E processing peptidase SpoIIGA [Roseburia sp.]|nr:sigma-E processing peptidase SpoIIGA [Ruminococcus sp.]MCM1154425.1 sigma-E processing peptidase SpoIIGA [Roseburia sp.]MCM1241885.1 sigma-E processing peptidase SpoIIGA [Roseburia sp.]
MYYKLYIDSVFFIQFVMNLYLLSTTGKILKCTATHRRILFGALLGAGMICLVIAVPAGSLRIRLFVGAIPVSIAMIRVVFAIRMPKLLIKSSIVMAVCGFFLGSIVLWLERCLARMGGRQYGIWTFAFFGLAGYVFLRFLIRRQQKTEENDLKKVRIPVGEENIYMNALLDTGNHLTEPLSGAPVCIISESAAIGIQHFFWPERYHAIPYQSVGRKKGILDAYEIPELFIEDTYREICCKRVIVAVCNTGISQDSIYQMILHPGLIEN